MNKQSKHGLITPREFGEPVVYPVPGGEPFQLGERVRWAGAEKAKFTDGEMFGVVGTVVFGRPLNLGFGWNTDRVIR